MDNVFDDVMNDVKMTFKPEFINRLDDIILFHRLSKENMGGIVNIQLRSLTKRLNNMGYNVTFSDKIINFLINDGFDPVYGARPLKRLIQREIENFLANKIIAGDMPVGEKIKVDLDKEGKVVIV